MTRILKNNLHVLLPIFLILMVFFLLTDRVHANEFNYQEYDNILNYYVYLDKNIEGYTLNVVDYDKLFEESHKSGSDFDKLLNKLKDFDPDSIESRDDRIAFWINIYNIGAIKMILDHFPVDSIRSSKINWLTNPWNKEIININGSMYSLGQIEHEILLGEYKELRAHFAIVCASLSCPEIVQEVYTGDNLEELITRQARKFFSYSDKGISIDREKNIVWVSRIFKYDSKNFKRGKEDIIPFIIPFIENEIDINYLQNADYRLKYLDYNWDLNTAKSVR